MKNKNKFLIQSNYPTISEYRSKQLLNIATAVGIGFSAATTSIESYAEEKKAVESKKTEDVNKKLKDKIILLVANLSDNNFKEREKATQSLISLGEKFRKEKKSKLTQLLKSKLEKCKKSKDPEVKKRACMVLLSITPKPPKRHAPPRLMGVPPPPPPPPIN